MRIKLIFIVLFSNILLSACGGSGTNDNSQVNDTPSGSKASSGSKNSNVKKDTDSDGILDQNDARSNDANISYIKIIKTKEGNNIDVETVTSYRSNGLIYKAERKENQRLTQLKEYDSQGNLILDELYLDPNKTNVLSAKTITNLKAKYTYDESNNILSKDIMCYKNKCNTQEPVSRETYNYHSNGNIKLKTLNALGADGQTYSTVKRNTYNEKGKISLIEEIDGDRIKLTKHTYNENGYLTQISQQNKSTSNVNSSEDKFLYFFKRDNSGKVLEVVDCTVDNTPCSKKEVGSRRSFINFSFDEKGQVILAKESLYDKYYPSSKVHLREYKFTYTPEGKVLSSQFIDFDNAPDQQVITKTNKYNQAGLVEKTSRSNSDFDNSFVYDSSNRLIKVEFVSKSTNDVRKTITHNYIGSTLSPISQKPSGCKVETEKGCDWELKYVSMMWE